MVSDLALSSDSVPRNTALSLTNAQYQAVQSKLASAYTLKIIGATTAIAATLQWKMLSPISVAIADLNGDGKPDLVVVNSGGVSVLLGTGRGPFAAPVSYQPV